MMIRIKIKIMIREKNIENEKITEKSPLVTGVTHGDYDARKAVIYVTTRLASESVINSMCITTRQGIL